MDVIDTLIVTESLELGRVCLERRCRIRRVKGLGQRRAESLGGQRSEKQQKRLKRKPDIGRDV